MSISLHDRRLARRAVSFALAIGVATTLGACGTDTSGDEGGGDGDSAQGSLVVVDTGGDFQAALKQNFYDPFQAEANVRVTPVASDNDQQWTKVATMSQGGNVEWDIVSSIGADLSTKRQFLHKFEAGCADVPNVAELGVEGACTEYGIGRTFGGVGIVYNTDEFPEGKRPQNWTDFFDTKKFPGRRALPDYGAPEFPLAAALMADGVAPEDLFPMDLDRAFEKLDTIRDDVKVFWKTGDQSQQIIRDGEVDLSMMWSGRTLTLQSEGVPVGFEWNQAGIDAAYWSVLKDAPHLDQALEFLDFFLTRPEAHQSFTKTINYATSNKEAVDSAPAELKANLATEANLAKMVEITGDPWVAENREEIIDRWNEWLSK